VGGTLLAATELEKQPDPGSETETKRIVSRVMRMVGEELGNTAAVARESYVSPAVVDAYSAGQTLAEFRRNGSGPSRMSADERALVRLLRSRS
jgi:DNA topoisomerase-1